MRNEIDWIIHLCANGVVCEECGEIEDGFIPYACNAHTHGMSRYGHPDFQVVLAYPKKEIGRILNTFGIRVRNGAKFHAGDLVSGIYEDCNVRLDEFEETGRMVLRVIIPDSQNCFPENPNCNANYRVQLLETENLYRKQRKVDSK